MLMQISVVFLCHIVQTKKTFHQGKCFMLLLKTSLVCDPMNFMRFFIDQTIVRADSNECYYLTASS